MNYMDGVDNKKTILIKRNNANNTKLVNISQRLSRTLMRDVKLTRVILVSLNILYVA